MTSSEPTLGTCDTDPIQPHRHYPQTVFPAQYHVCINWSPLPSPEEPREGDRPFPQAFVLQRTEDVTGVSGTGVVAEGVVFSDGTVSLRWTSDWPTSVVFHDRGIESVVAVHGHGGKTRIVYVHPPDIPSPEPKERCRVCGDSPAPIHYTVTDEGDPVDIWTCSRCAAWLTGLTDV